MLSCNNRLFNLNAIWQILVRPWPNWMNEPSLATFHSIRKGNGNIGHLRENDIINLVRNI